MSAAWRCEVKKLEFKKWVHKHERKLVIFAACVAVVTLLLKEIVREDLKDLKDSLSGANSTFVMRSNFAAIHSEVKDIAAHLYRMLNPKGDQGQKDQSAFFDIEDETDKTINHTDALKEEFDSMQDLLEAMDGTEEQYAQLEKFDGKVTDINNVLVQAIADYAIGVDKDPSRIRKIEDAEAGLEIDALKWEGDVLHDAQEKEKSRDTQYQTVTNVTYWLLGAAAVIGLLGRILDIKLGSAEE
jgi:hypothetical protein